MKTNIIHFSDDNSDKLYSIYCAVQGSGNSRDITKLKRILGKLIDGELTGLQRYCVTEYFYNHKRQNQIARELGVAPSTVCRHISRAVSRMKNVASYYS